MTHNLHKMLSECCFQWISYLKEIFETAGEYQTCHSQQDDIFFYWFIWISFLKNILKCSLIQMVNISQCLHTSIKKQNLIISLMNFHRMEFLPALEQMISWEFLHIWLLFFFVRSQLVGYWQASPDHPLSHLHFPQSHLPWPEDLTTSS